MSDVYAMGVSEIDEVKMLISTTTEFTDDERDTVIPAIIEGFRDSAREIQCILTINSVSVNPWCIIGGIATSVSKLNEIKL